MTLFSATVNQDHDLYTRVFLTLVQVCEFLEFEFDVDCSAIARFDDLDLFVEEVGADQGCRIVIEKHTV